MTNEIDEELVKHEDKFYHPYDPYPIQLQLMKKIYETLDNDEYKIGIFESPTGTGKTLSIICSVMKWLRVYKARQYEEKEKENVTDDNEPDWVNEIYQEKLLNDTKTTLNDYEKHLNELNEKYQSIYEKEYTESSDDDELKVKKKTRKIPKIDIKIDENEYLPNNYVGEDTNKSLQDKNTEISNEIKSMISSLKNQQDSTDSFDSLFYNNNENIKVIFSSRTHSQLSQFTEQLKLTKFPSSIKDLNSNEKIKYLSMGSRKQFCINEKVLKLKDNSSINDACIDLQKKENKNHCKYHKNFQNDENQETIKEIKNLTISKINDIEDLIKIGKNFKICPYYSINKQLETFDSIIEIVSVPYQLLLDENIRRQLNINIKNSIIIIDEAHNLMDTIIQLNSCKISINELLLLEKNLNLYFKKFLKKFNSTNKINLLKLLKVLKEMLNFVKTAKIKNGMEIKVNEIFKNDLINIYSIENYLINSKIAYKIETYIEKELKTKSSQPILFKFIKMLKLLINPSKEGKLFFNIDENKEIHLDYMLLNPIEKFRPVVESSRKVLLCGGTMEPINEFTEFLFPYEDRILKFNCDHIIPKKNVLVLPIEKSLVSKKEYDFSFTNRFNESMINDLLEDLIRITKHIPKGIIIFFPSFKYLEFVIKVWQKSFKYSKLNEFKKIFFETKNQKTDKLLSDYSFEINNSPNGAILLSIVNGKLSEGINFSNDLARSVIMIGLPYPNIFSGEIINKRKFIEDSIIQKGGSANDAKLKSQEFYENLCMKAINQSIGRSIRNIDDYSMIFLFDKRFKFAKIQNKLSGWIRSGVVKMELGSLEVERFCVDFFRNR